jgi:hypothetical protein
VNGLGHRLVGASCALGVAQVAHATVPQALALTAGAVAFSAGSHLSPDMDGHGIRHEMFGHRGLLHWWGLPAVVAGAMAWRAVPLLWWGPVIGWSSHIFPADFVFGKMGFGIPRGVPLWPGRYGYRLGFGLRVTGRFTNHSVLESLATVLVALVLVIQIRSFTIDV